MNEFEPEQTLIRFLKKTIEKSSRLRLDSELRSLTSKFFAKLIFFSYFVFFEKSHCEQILRQKIAKKNHQDLYQSIHYDDDSITILGNY